MTARSILITGCSSGIGLASALQMKARGWRVLATARKAEDLERLKREHNLETMELELADEASVKRCAEHALELTGGDLYAIFNNAAFGQVGAIEDLPVGLLRQQFEVNFFGTHELTRALIPSMRAKGRGRIVQCSSVLGLVAAPYRGAYCASKFALEGLTDALRLELEGSGISVSLIEPGPIRTRFVASALSRFEATIDIEGSPHVATYKARLERMRRGGSDVFKLEPEAVAEKLVHAVEAPRPKRRYYVTKPTYIASLMRRFLPTAVVDRVMKVN